MTWSGVKEQGQQETTAVAFFLNIAYLIEDVIVSLLVLDGCDARLLQQILLMGEKSKGRMSEKARSSGLNESGQGRI